MSTVCTPLVWRWGDIVQAANLAAAASLMAADRNGPVLRLQMLDYPCVDLSTDLTITPPNSTPEEVEECGCCSAVLSA